MMDDNTGPSRRPTLGDYLELHKLVEPLQTPATMGYFLYRIVRGARIFEQTSLMELRFSPYLRTDPALDVPQRIAAMANTRSSPITCAVKAWPSNTFAKARWRMLRPPA